MKVLIINLPRYKGSSVTREGRCELLLDFRVDTPATLLLIASLLRECNNSIEFIDANGLNLSYKNLIAKIRNIKFDVMIFTIASAIFEYDIKICSIVKRLNPTCITIGYSWWARKYGKEILIEYPNLDLLILDDPFSVINNLINTIKDKSDLSNVHGIVYRDEKNDIIVTSKIKSSVEFNDLPLPAYDLLDTFKPYYIYSPLMKPFALVYAGKGCPFGCKYCNVSRTKYSGRSAENILKELKLLKKLGNIKYVWFFDEVFTINRKRVIDLCKLIIKEKLNIKWLCDSRVDLVDAELLNIMRKGGCLGISYGVESGSQKILDLMNKGITVEQAITALELTKKAHIPVQLNLLLGYMGENKNTIKETENFVKKVVPDMLQIAKMMSMEGSEFYEISIKNKWITKDLDWKISLKSQARKLKNYYPYSLELHKVKQRIERNLYSNPIWWLYSIRTLLFNPKLLLPIIGTIVNRSKSIKII